MKLKAVRNPRNKFQAELRQVRSRQQQLEEKLLAITAACQESKYHEEVKLVCIYSGLQLMHHISFGLIGRGPTEARAG